MQKIILEGVALKPFVPSWVVRWAVPKFENFGPTHLERENLQDYNPEGVRKRGASFFEHLKESYLIMRCLGFEDGRSLISRGVLPLWFPGKHLCLWRSTAFDRDGNLFVPWIQNISGQTPAIYWWWIEYDLDPRATILFFNTKELLDVPGDS